MTNNPFSAELAAEHRRDLLQSATAYRQAKAARAVRRPARAGTPNPDDSASAQVAVEVVDEWQDRGVGATLVARLASPAAATAPTTWLHLRSAAGRCAS